MSGWLINSSPEAISGPNPRFEMSVEGSGDLRGKVAHLVAQLLAHKYLNSADRPDTLNVLSRLNESSSYATDQADRSLKVATRVRIPLGLQSGLDPI